MHGSRTRDCSGQRPQLDVSAMHSFTEVSNETPSPVLVSKSKRRLDLEWAMAYLHESYQACRGMNGVIFTPLVQARLLQCTSLSLCLLTSIYIYILVRGSSSTDIIHQQTLLDEHRSRLSLPILKASCRRKFNRTWPGTTSSTLRRSLRAISLYHLRGNTLSVWIDLERRH